MFPPLEMILSESTTIVSSTKSCQSLCFDVFSVETARAKLFLTVPGSDAHRVCRHCGFLASSAIFDRSEGRTIRNSASVEHNQADRLSHAWSSSHVHHYMMLLFAHVYLPDFVGMDDMCHWARFAASGDRPALSEKTHEFHEETKKVGEFGLLDNLSDSSAPSGLQTSQSRTTTWPVRDVSLTSDCAR